MALIVENGTLIANANSYASADSLRSYAKMRGINVSADNTELEQLLIRAMDFLESKRKKFKGQKVSSTQSLQWPRTGVYVDDCLVSSSSIPREIEYAQYALAIESVKNDLQPTRLPTDKGSVIKKKVEGAIEVEYSASPDSQRISTPAFAKAEALLTPLYKNNGFMLIRS